MYDAAELSQLPGLLAGELASIGRAPVSTTRENICAILDASIARATVAEALAYERLENMLFAEQRGDDAEIERDEAIARASAAEARAAELEAALDAERAERAAWQWRLRAVDGEPPHDGLWPTTTVYGTVDILQFTHGYGWHSARPQYVVAWFPLPPSPFAPPTEEPTQ